MTTYYEIGDKLKGYKILCEARQIKQPKIIPKTGRHKAQKITLKDNAKCRVLKQARFVSDKKIV